MHLSDLGLPPHPLRLTQVELQGLAQQWGNQLPAGTTLLLEGDLGSGKTTFVQGLGAGLGIREPIVSPTFTLIQEYPEGRLPLYHFDLYRLSELEIVQLHPELYWAGDELPLGLVAIEWPKTLEQLMKIPAPVLHLSLAVVDGQTRELQVSLRNP